MNSNLCLLAIIPLLLVGCSPDSGETMSKVTSSGEASIEVKPDIATIGFQVLSFNKDAAIATQDLALATQKIVTYFSEQNVPAKDIEAHDIEKNIVRRTDDSGRLLEILGYEITRSFSVKLTDLKKFEKTMYDLYAMPNISRLHTSFESEDREKLEAELMQKACLQATAEAEQMAKGFGVRLGRVYRISRKPIVEMFDSAEMELFDGAISARSEGRDGPLFYPPATIKLSQEVHAVFEVHN
ncbi:MAG: SIMPL domain-containing protein [Candidatus Methylacidiphilales bacterium]|nr:SIMPL domain-containing protein [Candidatus Methylacidiphilales bacterium]